MISKYYGDYTFSGCFVLGKLADGTYGSFDDVEDYEAYRDTLQNQTVGNNNADIN